MCYFIFQLLHFKLFLIFSLCGFSNAFSVKSIEDHHIDHVQSFVRDQLNQRLSEKCTRWQADLHEDDKKHFFGMFQDSIGDFEFMMGDRATIHVIVDYLRKLFDTLGSREAFAQYFAVPPRYKLSKTNTSVFPVGTFFGKTTRARLQSSSLEPVDLAANLLTTELLPLFNRYKTKLNAVRPASA